MTKLRLIIRDIVKQQFELQKMQPQMVAVKSNDEKWRTLRNSRKTLQNNF